ncbi:high affinity glucose transporter [Thecaphora frezii]
MTIPALLYLDRWGRRRTLIIGSTLMMTWLICMAALMATHGHYVPSTGVVRWRVEGSKHVPNADRATVLFPNKATVGRYIDIVYLDHKTWMRSLRLSLDFPGFFKLFRSAIGTYLDVKEMWAEYSWRSDGYSVFYGMVMFLSRYKPQYGPTNMPGWLQDRNFQHFLYFLGCTDLYIECRLKRRPHTNADGTWCWCKRCGKRDHKRGECGIERPDKATNSNFDLLTAQAAVQNHKESRRKEDACVQAPQTP